MNTLTTERPFDGAGRTPTRQLGVFEARRLLLHPSYVVAIAATTLAAATLLSSTSTGGSRPVDFSYATVLLFGAMFYPLTTVVAANRISLSTFRRQPQESMAVTPTQERERTMAVCLGLVTGPVLVGIGIMVIADLIAPAVVGSNGLVARGVVEHLQIPVTVLGAGLLGVALARWVRVPGLLALVVLALWFGHFTLSVSMSAAGQQIHGAAWLGLMPTWLFSDTTMAVASPLSQELWHLLYLLGLALLAGVAALLHAPGNRRPLLLTGVALVVITGVAAVLQMG